MKFAELLALVSPKSPIRICTDSRLVDAGDIFVAVKGNACNGYDFIDDAVAAGAKYIVSEKPRICTNAEVIVVDDPTEAAATLAQAAEGNPASQLTNLAVTGTNGKTTVAFAVRSIIQNANQNCGLIGTVLYDTGKESCPAQLTTPDCLTIAQIQQQMLQAGTKYMIIEASSHALYQNRLAGINFKAAAFTNLTGDHLDYHKTEKNYLAAKSKLFEALSSDATAVLNKQSPHSSELAKKTNAKLLWYGIEESADVTAHIVSADINETTYTLEYAGNKQQVKSALLGHHNVSNHLAAAGLCLAAGFDLKTVASGLADLKVVPGRLEKIYSPCDFSVIVDYAHTDDALKNVLTTLRPLCKERLSVVFGCGGDRDKTKRLRMAAVVEELADCIFVTSDNPRTEQPAAIIGEIMTGFKDPVSEKITAELDRATAIELAIQSAKKDDIILIAGKGHETYQIIGNKKFDFSDKQVAQKCLQKLK